ncbi:MAG TPA: metallophosphoesterase family protein [Anaeromyxobacteraceae bacterium]|nr:metallophosphoesterase family protein [Anaeromyxobacteraceae bacterium]
MRVALFADIHSNLDALTACLAEAEAHGAERYAFLGDLVGYGAEPAAVIDLVAGYAARGAIVVRGNHDEAVLAGDTASMRDVAAAAVDWTRGRLDARRLAFLEGLPLTVREGEALYVHASAEEPEQWTYVSDEYMAARSLAASHGARYVLCGHVHEPTLFYTSAAERPVPFTPVPGRAIPVPSHRRWLVVVGSVGQPRDHDTAACWAMLDLARHTLTFHRVPYDWRAAAAKIRAAGLPEYLAARIERGE